MPENAIQILFALYFFDFLLMIVLSYIYIIIVANKYSTN